VRLLGKLALGIVSAILALLGAYMVWKAAEQFGWQSGCVDWVTIDASGQEIGAGGRCRRTDGELYTQIAVGLGFVLVSMLALIRWVIPLGAKK
jgi:hypothetical protein